MSAQSPWERAQQPSYTAPQHGKSMEPAQKPDARHAPDAEHEALVREARAYRQQFERDFPGTLKAMES